MLYTEDFTQFGQNQDEAQGKEKGHETHMASNFCSKHKNPAIRLFIRSE